MRIANARTIRWRRNRANVRGSLAVKPLLVGRPGTPENYLCNVARSAGDYASPRHRHNFDQVRIVLDGKLPVTPQRTMQPGEIGYFPEGTWYGPQQDDGTGWTIMIVQFGGASGDGFLSAAEALEAKQVLMKEGEFQGGVFRRLSGSGKRNQDSYEAVWEHANARRLVYPKPRYDAPVILDPAGFGWKPASKGAVARKNLGIFTERETRLDMVRVADGGQYTCPPKKAIQLLFVMSGNGTCNGKPYDKHALVELAGGEAATFEAVAETEIFCLVMPLVKAATARAA
jgi:hypothetical protein